MVVEEIHEHKFGILVKKKEEKLPYNRFLNLIFSVVCDRLLCGLVQFL